MITGISFQFAEVMFIELSTSKSNIQCGIVGRHHRKSEPKLCKTRHNCHAALCYKVQHLFYTGHLSFFPVICIMYICLSKYTSIELYCNQVSSYISEYFFIKLHWFCTELWALSGNLSTGQYCVCNLFSDSSHCNIGLHLPWLLNSKWQLSLKLSLWKVNMTDWFITNCPSCSHMPSLIPLKGSRLHFSP